MTFNQLGCPKIHHVTESQSSLRTNFLVQSLLRPGTSACAELSEPKGLVAEPEDACFSDCVASAPTKVEVPVLEQARTPDSSPKAFNSPAVFTGPPESNNIDNAIVTGTPSAFSDRHVPMEVSARSLLHYLAGE